MKAGLRAKLLIPILAAVIVSMGAAGYFSATNASQALSEDLVSTSKHIVQGLSVALGVFADGIRDATALQSTKESVVRVFADKNPETLKAARETLKELMRFDEAIQGANLLDTKGDVVVG